MTVIRLQVLGGYPRSRYVRRLLRDAERGEASYGQLALSLIKASAAVIGAQLSAGMDVVVDGMLDWHDIFRPFASSWRNVTPSALLRYFDNNFFYRIPLFTGEPEPTYPVLAPRVRELASLAEPAKLKVVVPGPVTFARMSENRAGVSVEELAEAIARLLADEVRAASEAGAGFIQIDEPYLTDPDATRDDAELAAELASRIASSAPGSESMIALYFYPVKSEVYGILREAKVDFIMVDAVAGGGRALEAVVSKGGGVKGVALGVIDSRSIYPDKYDDVRRLVERVVGGLKGDLEQVILTTSTWMDLIPYRYSLVKTRLLGVYTEKLSTDLNLTYGGLGA